MCAMRHPNQAYSRYPMKIKASTGEVLVSRVSSRQQVPRLGLCFLLRTWARGPCHILPALNWESRS